MFQTIDQLIRKDVEFVLFTVCFNRIGESIAHSDTNTDMWSSPDSRELQVLTPDQTIVGHLDGDTILVVLPGKLSDQELYRFGERLATLSKHCFQLEPYRCIRESKSGSVAIRTTRQMRKRSSNGRNMAMGRAGKMGVHHFLVRVAHEISTIKTIRVVTGLAESD